MQPTPHGMHRSPLWFTFGNHMHWVDMQWLWGYQVLPDSIDDMLALCAAVGARGNVNFDAIGYEKLAAEDPAALARLRDAIADGTVEVVGATYGQPYGLFHGGESNVRQQVFGARVVRRLCGVWPRSFWEEEFDCFPQLPQILRGAGFDAASLFFQWTWHTPTIPDESVPLVHWQGIDGTRIATLTKTALCLHQWPEDFDGRLELAATADPAVLVQWLELMPSPDWMCRSEVLLPKLRELFNDPRFEVRAATLGQLVAALDTGDAPVRAYPPGALFHGMTLGKNGDRYPIAIDRVEVALLGAESLAAVTGLLDRPYASWDVYPTWELDEGWRDLLAAEHHDNHECEGLCGAIGMHALRHAEDLAAEVRERTLAHVAAHVAVLGDRLVVQNALGWPRDLEVAAPPDWDGDAATPRVARAVPAFGWVTIARDDRRTHLPVRAAAVTREGPLTTLRVGDRAVTVDTATGTIVRIDGPDGAVDLAIGRLAMRAAGAAFEFGPPTVDLDGASLTLRHAGPEHALDVTITVHADRVSWTLDVERLPRPDPGYGGALRLSVDGFGPGDTLRHDTPYAVDAVEPSGSHARKYPSGDWMTSPQWFETVERPFTARTFVDVVRDAGPHLACVHDGHQGWQRTDSGVDVVLFAYDPWDEARALGPSGFHARLEFVPHDGWSHAALWRRAAELRDSPAVARTAAAAGDVPATFGGLVCEPAHVVATALFREHRKAFEHVPAAFGPDVRNPFVVRLVEFDGIATEVRLRVPGPCSSAARTDLLGNVVATLHATACDPPPWSPAGLPWCELRFTMRAREIATVMLDLELGRHAPRHLDAHRHIWATVHRR